MKYLIVLIIASLMVINGYGQTISGRVVDSQKKSIEGAYIFLKSSGQHVHSDENGMFNISAPTSSDTLVISHMTYYPTSIPMDKNSNNLLVKLQEKVLSLEEVKISPNMNSLLVFTDIDLHYDPVNSSQEILRKVPGLIIGQHAGGGKAEQIFLRGFDIDHGTDINITVDGMPVNMVSHAHGQGYADLHFLIPETINKIDFGKGTYYADKGNFTTAGYVDFQTKDVLDESLVKLKAGSFNSLQMLGMFNLIDKENQSAYVATDYQLTDGPFESPQNFSRFNLMGKFSHHFANHDHLSILISAFKSEWDASGQIPQRAVEAGTISRFGAIDDTEGGNTSRNNIIVKHNKQLDSTSWISSTAYCTWYDFELYSNFTFFLNDPLHGDQIKQKEKRTLVGMHSTWNKRMKNSKFQVGVGYRNDLVNNNELSHTFQRKITLSQTAMGDINETNAFSFFNYEFRKNSWLINAGLRYDWFKFIYSDLLSNNYKKDAVITGTISPKLNILYSQSENLQFYLKTGKGFHSNDSRAVVNEQGIDILPAAWGTDVGFIWKPNSKLIINTALWQLRMQQEFVYVGDEGIIEAGGETQRAGIDFGARLQLFNNFFFDSDLNYAFARSIDEPEGQNYIPLAPDLTITGGLGYLPESGLFGNLNYRFIKDRPANEDFSITAEGYSIFDVQVGYRWKSLECALVIENLLNTDWNETQFATETRLQNETTGVEEIHFIPGTPFSLQLSVSYLF